MPGKYGRSRGKQDLIAQAEGPSGSAVGLATEAIVPTHLLDGGEVVHFAIKPSPWFVLLVSLRWVVVAAFIACIAGTDVVTAAYRPYAFKVAIALAGARLVWATLEWVSRLYVLTNRRVMSIRGVFSIEMFECALNRIQNTYLTLAAVERIVRVGTVSFQTAAAGGGTGGTGAWQIIAKPLEVHEKLRDAINRAQNRGNDGV